MYAQLIIRIIIAINVFVYLAWNYNLADQLTPEFMVDHFLVSFDGLANGRYWTLIGSVFSHNLLLHLLMNMFVLNSFGPIVAATLGPFRFLTFYFVAGVISSLSHALVSAYIIGDPSLPALGASGAIAGIILLFSLFYPRQKILLFAFIPMPAVFGALAFVALDIWGLIAQADGGGLPIGHGAHLGGALTGLVYFLIISIFPKGSDTHER